MIKEINMPKAYLKNKKLLVLGGSTQMINLTLLAQSLGCEVHVLDYYSTVQSPAKLIADAYSDLSIFDTEAVVSYIKENNIDGVITGYTDSYLFQYKEICEKAGLPYYGSDESFGIGVDKMLFKQACIKSNVGIIPGTNAYDFDTVVKFAEKNGYPLMLKPTDNSGSRGVIKCEKEEDLKDCYEYALSFSKSKNVIVERFMQCDSIGVSYQLQGKDIYLSAMCDRFVYKTKNGSAITSETQYPSKYLKRFIESEDANLRRLFRDNNFKDGVVAVMGYVDDDGFYWCEMTYRPSGGHHYTFINDQVGVNGLALLIEYAVTGKTESYDPKKETPFFKDRCGMVHIQGVPNGFVSRVEGVDTIRSMSNVLEVAEDKQVGQTIGDEGTTAQNLLSVWIKAETWEKYFALIREIESVYKVFDEEGNNLVIKRR